MVALLGFFGLRQSNHGRAPPWPHREWLICRCGFPIVTISDRTRARYRPENEAESSLRCRGLDFETILPGGILVELPRD